MLMVIAAVCFIVFELYKVFTVFTAKSVYNLMLKFKNDRFSLTFEERELAKAILFTDLLYFIWAITALFFPEWRFVAGIITGLGIVKIFLPKSIWFDIFDSIICAQFMIFAVVRIAPQVISWPPM